MGELLDRIKRDLHQDTYYGQNFANDGERFLAWYLRNVLLRTPVQARDDITVHLTVDKAEGPWNQHVGVVTTVLEGLKPGAQNTLALVCGPPIMIRFTLLTLARLGFADDAILLSLEMRMKCGIGKCGRCNIGSKYVCKDGPVFTREELKALPAEY